MQYRFRLRSGFQRKTHRLVRCPQSVRNAQGQFHIPAPRRIVSYGQADRCRSPRCDRRVTVPSIPLCTVAQGKGHALIAAAVCRKDIVLYREVRVVLRCDGIACLVLQRQLVIQRKTAPRQFIQISRRREAPDGSRHLDGIPDRCRPLLRNTGCAPQNPQNRAAGRHGAVRIVTEIDHLQDGILKVLPPEQSCQFKGNVLRCIGKVIPSVLAQDNLARLRQGHTALVQYQHMTDGSVNP